ncbi:MAG: hypothetical protein LUE14_03005 [Clostridiales bacterium]|nr:hypothetical protein [Clostridiales bacterium]
MKKKAVFGILRIYTMALPCLCACAVFMDSARITIAQEVQEEAEQEEEIQEDDQGEAAIDKPELPGPEEMAEAQAQTQENPVFITAISAPDLYIQTFDGFVPAWEILNEGVDDSIMELCGQTLSVLPGWVKTKVALSGWTFAVTPEDINSRYLGSKYDTETVTVSGAALYGEQKIVVAGTEEACMSAPLHEIGHWCDWITADGAGEFSSESGEFEAIYAEEAEAFISVFGLGSVDTDSRQELCADLFKYYWMEPEELLATCPGLYAWMDELVGELQMMGF